jgi:predicted PurR-regulated permease PerM
MAISNRYLALIFSLLVIAALVYFFTDIVVFVVISWVLSMLGQPLMRFFQNKVKIWKWRLGRNISAVLVLLVYFLVLFLLFILFVPLIVEQANNLASVDYTLIFQALEEPIQQLEDYLHEMGLLAADVSAQEQLREALKLEDWFNPGQVSELFTTLLSTAGNLFITLFSIVFVTFFFLREQGLFTNFLVAIMPNKYEEQVRDSVDNISHLLTRYFGGIVVQMTVITLFVSILLSILGVKNALLIGFFAALINLIPYLGPIIGAVFGIFITISSNLEVDFYTTLLPLILKVATVFAGMQLLDNFVLQPWIYSSSVLAHPLEIFIVILMGAQLGGIVGMVLAIPLYTVLRVVAREFLSEFQVVQRLTKGMEEEVDR